MKEKKECVEKRKSERETAAEHLAWLHRKRRGLINDLEWLYEREAYFNGENGSWYYKQEQRYSDSLESLERCIELEEKRLQNIMYGKEIK